ncbi:MAG: hypothetical protein JRJ03_01355 [Deltaproteobacteria bacterium]|nr:hypothetical protein [Deltaproteobacteria bacterium]
MPSKYMIHTRPVPNRFKAISKSGVIAWEEGCLRCAVCVKKKCVYGVYENRALDPRQMVDSIDHQCMNCFRCVQSCPKELIHKSVIPEFRSLGDRYWMPDIISRLWYQAETGKIPVSGAGYPGPFSGPGFDAMWTDMSEIVRPTRDGIHGREYISTAVDIGKTPRQLSFSSEGELMGETPQIISIPMPMMLKVPQFGSLSRDTIKGWARAAKELGTLLALPDSMLSKELRDLAPHLIPLVPEGASAKSMTTKQPRLVEIPWHREWHKTFEDLKTRNRAALVSLRLPLREGIEERVISCIRRGVSIVHVETSDHGTAAGRQEVFMRDGIRSVHLALVEAGFRDEVTLLASGGLAMAEHVAKALICGADAVLVDIPLLVALECRVCRRCTKGLSCPVEIEKAPPGWVAGRVINLLGAWHNQLLEVMGAMGIRDARRLRGEAGRAMFYEDLDRSTFGSMGGKTDGHELE